MSDLLYAFEAALIRAFAAPDVHTGNTVLRQAPLPPSWQEVGQHLLAAHVTARDEAERDPLTALPRRRRLEAEGERLLALAHRHRFPATLLWIDLDGLKHTNTTEGYQAGDDRLRTFAQALTATLRSTDLATRWGGDEFVLLLPHTDAHGAQALLQRLRKTSKETWTASYAEAPAESLATWVASAQTLHLSHPTL